MRPRIKSKGSLCFVAHTNGQGYKSIEASRHSLLCWKYDYETLTEEESQELLSLVKKGFKAPKSFLFVEVTVFGIKKKVTRKEYKEHYEPLGF